jgi:cold shock protein
MRGRDVTSLQRHDRGGRAALRAETKESSDRNFASGVSTRDVRLIRLKLPDRSQMGRGKDFRDRRRGYSDEMPDQPPAFGRPPPRSFDRPPPSRPVPTGPERQAKVKWFNGEKGFGFVELTDGTGEAFLHISVVEAAGHTALESGTTLTVRVGQGAKGPQITEITAVDASTAEPRSPRPGGGRPSLDRPARGFERPTGPAEDCDGHVKWYDPKKGFGFVAVEGSKDVFIHRSVLAREGITELQEGQRIHMRVVPGAKGLEATSVEIKHEG